ncbi:hypothetical protein SUGI_0841510 [Cryptomeria japonica]|nr:hypothetical protein SUGI_0841510 [Cryptomeria japonica]
MMGYESRLTAVAVKLSGIAAPVEEKKMLKHHKHGGAPTGIFSSFWKPTFLILFALGMLLLPLCIFNSFLIFHLSLFVPRSDLISNSSSVNGSIRNSSGLINQNSSKFVLRRKQKQPIMEAIREENPYNFTLSHNNHSNPTPSEKKVSVARKHQEQIEEETGQTGKTGDSFPKELHQNVNGSEIETEVEYRGLSVPIVSLDKPPLNVSEEERIKWLTQNLASFKILHSDSLSSHFRSKVKSFFHNCTLQFFMTWISKPEAFGPREILSVESVFKWHPSACLLIISRSMDSETGREILDPFVSRGFRVMAAAPDLMYLFKGTGAATWLRNVKAGKIDPGEISFAQNLSNIIRLAALHMYGGIYMDSDVIILKSMAKLKNVIGAQSMDQRGHWNRLNNAVLVFKKMHPLVTEFMEEFARNFNGNKWGYNGPYLVTRAVQHFSRRSKIRFQVMPPMAFYPFDWMRIGGYFRRNSGRKWIQWRKAKLLQMEGETYAVHLWNKQSRQLQVEEGSIIHHFFNKCCVLCLDKHYLHNNFTV